MPLGTPIEFILYGDDDEVKAVFARKRIPLMFVEQAIELADHLKGDQLGQDQLMAIYQLLVDFYGDKFTIEDLRKGADLGEMIAVIQEITTRATELMPETPNPTPPPG